MNGTPADDDVERCDWCGNAAAFRVGRDGEVVPACREHLEQRVTDVQFRTTWGPLSVSGSTVRRVGSFIADSSLARAAGTVVSMPLGAVFEGIDRLVANRSRQPPSHRRHALPAAPPDVSSAGRYTWFARFPVHQPR